MKQRIQKEHQKQVILREKAVQLSTLTNPKEKGRSMVEMLGVLAVIGVLSVGGIMGYKYGMMKYRVNETINELNIMANTYGVQMQQMAEEQTLPTEGELLSEENAVTRMGYGYEVLGFDNHFEIALFNVPNPECEQLQKTGWELPYEIKAETVTAENCGELVYYIDNGLTGTLTEYIDSDAEDDEEQATDAKIPDLNKGDKVVSKKINPKQHFTQPPPRYNEASLVKALEEHGIGRPSTYATIISNIRDRGYVNVEDKKFIPTDIGFEVTDKLQEFFSGIINVEYTANMESDLDKIAEENEDNIKVLHEFYDSFEPLVKKAFGEMEKKAPESTGETCPECGSPLVIRKGKYGEFVACSNYPECKYIKKEEKEIKEIVKCPKCSGTIVEKTSKKGKIFYGCNNYPKCKTATWDIPTGEICPNCGELLVTKNNKVKCSSCEYEKE